MSLFDVLPDSHTELETATRSNHRIDPQVFTGGLKSKVKRAIAAIAAFKHGEADDLSLVHYLGSGILADLFVTPVKPEWADLSEQLKNLLTDDEYEQVRATVTTAYYTPPEIVRAMYKAGEHFGLKGGKFLDPTIGNGLFIGMTPPEWNTEWTGVEVDPISSRIAQQLYPQATIYAQALERTRLPNAHFDAVWGNVPYSEVTPYDPQFSQWQLDGLHNYCILRSVMATRPGGIVALLTSVGTLQSKRSQGFREKLSEQVRLLGAFKLPMGAFRKFSHTDAPADLLFLQVLQDGEEGNADQWVDLVESEIVHPETGEPLLVNQYFVANPHHLLGELALDKLYASPRLSLVATHENLEDALTQAIATLPPNCYSLPVQVEQSDARSSRSVPIPPELQGSVKPFAYLWHENEPWQCRGGMLHKVEVDGKQRRRLWKLIALREAVRAVIDVQWESDDDAKLQVAQRKLDRLYDEFITHYGWVHDLGNSMAFGDDPEYPLVLSIENYDADQPEKTTKADIFTKRTIQHIAPVETVQSAFEALIQSLITQGKVDLEYMEWLYHKSHDEMVLELQSADEPMIFFDPQQKAWVTAEDYLSGNVREKLKLADLAAQSKPNYLINVTALKQVQPKDLDAGQIYVRLGSPWVPKEVIEQFIRELLNVKDKAVDPKIRSQVKVTHDVQHGRWTVDYSGGIDPTLNTSKYGTSRVSAIKLIDLALNQRLPEVYDYIDRDTQRKNREETHKALLKQEQIKDHFKRWVWQDWERAIALVEIYNRDFNCFRERKFDGAYLRNQLQGVSTVWLERVSAPERRYQLDAIHRQIVDGNTQLQHPTGAGKTATAIIASQEMRRHRLCFKPALAVPDHLVWQQAGEALQIYPGLRVLPISTRELNSAQKRQELSARIATGVWDLVVVSHTALKMMPLSPQMVQKIIADEVSSVRDAYSGQSGKRAMKQQEKAVDRKEEKVRANVDGVRRDNTVYFDQTGIDYLFIDESQNFLGLPTETQMRGVLGVAGSESQKAEDLYYKTQFLAAIHGEGRGINLMTATPIQNTLGQSWVNLVYLCPQTLKARGIRTFDAFIATFAEATFMAEKTAAGTIEAKMRLSKWSNIPEFRALWLTVADIVHERDLHINKPKPIYDAIEVAATPSQIKFFDYVAERARKIKKREVESDVDNYPLITTHVKLGVIDLRLLNPYVLRDFLTEEEIAGLAQERSKLAVMVDNVYDAWTQYQSERYTQLVFLDIGTPNTNGRFSAYTWAKQQWIERGIPEAEIAFIHDANSDKQKAELFADFRAGKVRILMGSTAKLGAGTQIPNRLKHLWDVDCPLRPTDFEQRHGRILRPGNMHKEVNITSLITVGKPYQKDKQIQGLSPDSYLYEVNQRKATFIREGLYSEDETLRTIEDIDETTFDFGILVATASGDRRFLDKVNLDNEVARLMAEEASWRGTQVSIQSKLSRLPKQIEMMQNGIVDYQQDFDRRIPTSGKQFTIEVLIDGIARTITQRTAAGFALQSIANRLELAKISCEERIGSFAGFELWAVQISDLQTQLVLRGAREYISVVRQTPKGTLAALEHALDEIEDKIEQCQDEIASMQRELETIAGIEHQPFEKAAQLQAVLDRQAALNEELGMTQSDQLEVAAA